MAVSGTGTGILNFTASGDMATGPMIIDSVRWIGATATAQQCLVTDFKGNVLFASIADGANFIDGWVFDQKWVDGIEMSSLNSGQVQMYHSRFG